MSSLSPAEIVNLAVAEGIRAIALTDHDTLEGARELLKQGIPRSINFITGVEISCSFPDAFDFKGSMHILGYGFDIDNPALNDALDHLKSVRAGRNPQIIKKLNNLGIDISLAEVRHRFNTPVIGRPHIAKLMVEKGITGTFDEAFDRYLAEGKPAYVDKYRIPCTDAVAIIRQAGGLSVLAHPGLIKTPSDTELVKLVRELKSIGLKGMEVYYTDHGKKETAFLERLADGEDLIKTGGSDFHGDFNKGIALGKGTGSLVVPDSIWIDLKEKLNIYQSIPEPIEILQDNIGYHFKKPSLLLNALCHSSYINERPEFHLTDNEKLEFIGDAVLDLSIGHLLMERDHTRKEGELSKLRASLVCEPFLADMARSIGLNRFILLGKGERMSGGCAKDSILSDVFEAVIAAVYFDGSYNEAHDVITRLFDDKIDTALTNGTIEDFKSRLQEFIQETRDETPAYRIDKETGPDHDKRFEAIVRIRNIEAKGIGKSKKTAEQAAARQALKLLNQLNF